MKTSVLVLTMLLLGMPGSLLAIDESKLPEKLHTVFGLYLTPHEAFNLKTEMGDKVLFVDVRARPELKYVGASPLIDANIPSRFINTDFTWSDKVKSYRTRSNKHFVADFEKLLNKTGKTKQDPIILICQSGSRVPLAAKILHDAGFKQVYSQYQGFEGVKAKTGKDAGKRVVNGWKNAGLPWSLKLNNDAMYFNFDSTRKDSSE